MKIESSNSKEEAEYEENDPESTEISQQGFDNWLQPNALVQSQTYSDIKIQHFLFNQAWTINNYRRFSAMTNMLHFMASKSFFLETANGKMLEFRMTLYPDGYKLHQESESHSPNHLAIALSCLTCLDNAYRSMAFPVQYKLFIMNELNEKHFVHGKFVSIELLYF